MRRLGREATVTENGEEATNKVTTESSNIEKARALSAGQGRELFKQLEGLMTNIVELNDLEMERAKNLSERNFVFSRNLLMGMGIFAVLASIGAGWFITRGLTRTLRIVTERIDNIAESAGDLTTNISVASRDEIGDLAKAFNQMLGGLKEMVNQVIGSSQSVSASSQQLSAAAQQTNASVQQVSSAVEQLASGQKVKLRV